jgi:RimJ/RimL family protein N-acetyltransferase
MILGQRIRLRPMEREDLPRFVRWFADEETRSYLDQYLPIGLAQEDQWFERNLQAGDRQAWSIDAQPADMTMGRWDHIGACGFNQIDWRCRRGEVGIFIGTRENWGWGYGTDAMRTLVRWGFDILNLNRIWLRVYADNPRAIRCYQKAGFVEEGRLRQHDFRNGAYRDALVLGLLRSEWEALAAADAAGSTTF